MALTVFLAFLSAPAWSRSSTTEGRLDSEAMQSAVEPNYREEKEEEEEEEEKEEEEVSEEGTKRYDENEKGSVHDASTRFKK